MLSELEPGGVGRPESQAARAWAKLRSDRNFFLGSWKDGRVQLELLGGFKFQDVLHVFTLVFLRDDDRKGFILFILLLLISGLIWKVKDTTLT